MVHEYLARIPDVESKYVINDRLSKILSNLYQGKISVMPLYKVSLKIDRNLIKIPWTLETNPDIPSVKEYVIKNSQ